VAKTDSKKIRNTAVPPLKLPHDSSIPKANYRLNPERPRGKIYPLPNLKSTRKPPHDILKIENQFPPSGISLYHCPTKPEATTWVYLTVGPETTTGCLMNQEYYDVARNRTTAWQRWLPEERDQMVDELVGRRSKTIRRLAAVATWDARSCRWMRFYGATRSQTNSCSHHRQMVDEPA
jgi:hypothetical protein